MRMPGLCDVLQWLSVEEVEEYQAYQMKDWEDADEMERIGMRTTMLLYLADEAAIRSGKINLIWLNSHGDCTWDNKIDPGEIENLIGNLFDGGFRDTLESRASSSRLMIRGTEL